MIAKPERLYLPLFFNLQDHPCLVVGGGKVAARKVSHLLYAGAQVTIVSPQICAELKIMLQLGRCVWSRREYQSPEAAEYRLVIATTDDPAVNQRIFSDCEKHGIPVNVVDQPQLCTVIFPAIIKRGTMTLAIGSSGKIPFFTRALRLKLEEFIESLYPLEKEGLLLKFREFVRGSTENFELKQRLYRRLLDCPKEIWSQWQPEHPPYELWMQWLKEEELS